ncbi:MAG: hypothetical protein AAF990_27875 [Bacteroidota bacterium]
MQKWKFALAVACFGLLLGACTKEEPTPTDLQCTGDCLFTVNNVRGTMVRMNCFERFGIEAEDPTTEGRIVIGLPDQLDKRYEEEGKEVTFSAVFRTNQLVPLFPDPDVDPSTLYQIDISTIKE